MPSIALCIPMYRSAGFLPDLVARLRRMHPLPGEIIFLDDASPDDSGKLLQELVQAGGAPLPCRLVRNAANEGIGSAYNRLAREAQAEWVHILDADDYPVEADFYARIEPELLAHRDLLVTAIRSNSTLLRLGAAAIGWAVPRSPPQWLPLLGSFATRAGVIYRRSCLLDAPFPDPAFPGSDVLHLLSLRRGRNCGFTRSAHVHYRVHRAATSSGARNYGQYRLGLSRFGRPTRLAHALDLSIRILGQRIGRR